MADIIRLTASELEALANQFANACTENTEMVNTLGSAVEAAAAGWEGDAYNAFVDKFVEIKKQMDSVSEMYTGIHDLLIKVRDAVVNTDSEIASSIRS